MLAVCLNLISATENRLTLTGLEVQVHIKMSVAISFGLDIFISVIAVVSTTLEVIMKNSFAVSCFMACVWCGIAFLRSLVEIPTQARDREHEFV